MDSGPTQQRQVVLAARERRVRQALRQVPLRRGGPGVPEERGGAPGLERGRGRGEVAHETVGPRDPAPEQLLGRRLRPADSRRADVPVARRMTQTARSAKPKSAVVHCVKAGGFEKSDKKELTNYRPIVFVKIVSRFS